MPTVARNHCESRKVVCILCLRKTKAILSSSAEQRIRSFFHQDIDFNDPRVPCGICTTCRIDLVRKEKGQDVSLPKLHDFSQVFVPRFLRSSPISCNCMICKIARSGSLKSKLAVHPLGLGKKKKGRPNSSNIKAAEKQCPKCLTTVAKGKHHSCTPGTLAKNMAKKLSRGC